MPLPFDLPDEFAGGPLPGTPGSPEWQAQQQAQEEAAAFAAIANRNTGVSPLALQQAATHSPIDGNAAAAAAGLPLAPLAPLTPPPVAAPVPLPPAPAAQSLPPASPVAVASVPGVPGVPGAASRATPVAAPVSALPTDEIVKATEARQGAEQNLEAAQGQNAQATSFLQQAGAVDRERQAKERQASVNTAKSELDAAARERKNFKYTDWWSDRSNGQKFLAGLGIILSGVNWSKGHVNGAVQTIQQSIKDDMELQKKQFQSLQYAEEMKRQGYVDADSMAAKAMVDYDKAFALKLKSAADVLESNLKGVRSEVARTRGQEELSKLREAQKFQEQKFTEGAADIAVKRGQVKVQNATVNHLNAQAENERAMAANGGGSKLGNDNKLLIQISGQVQQQIQKDPEAKHAVEGLDKYSDALAAIRSGEGIGTKLSIDELTKAATGLGARPQSIKVFEGATGGSFQQLLGAVRKARSGDSMTDVQKANVEKFLTYTIDERKKKLAEVATRIGGGMKKNPAYNKHPEIIDAALEQHFGAPSAVPAPAAPAAAGKMVTIRNGKTGETKQVTEAEARQMGAIQ